MPCSRQAGESGHFFRGPCLNLVGSSSPIHALAGSQNFLPLSWKRCKISLQPAEHDSGGCASHKVDTCGSLLGQANILRPAFFIGVDDQKRLVVLGIRGTTQAHDLFTDLSTAGEEFLDGGYAHAGMLHAAKWFVEHEAKTLKEQLQQNKVTLRHPQLPGQSPAYLSMASFNWRNFFEDTRPA
jgi:hypothetical protein